MHLNNRARDLLDKYSSGMAQQFGARDTPLSNLHIYTQRNTRMRKAEFVEDRKQFENKYLRNEGYAVEVPELYRSSFRIKTSPARQAPQPNQNRGQKGKSCVSVAKFLLKARRS